MAIKRSPMRRGLGERRGIHVLSDITQGKETEFDTVTSAANAASDHGAVWAEFAV